MFEKIFHLKENHTDVKTEVMAGITTFMTMAYILAVNPSILYLRTIQNVCVVHVLSLYYGRKVVNSLAFLMHGV